MHVCLQLIELLATHPSALRIPSLAVRVRLGISWPAVLPALARLRPRLQGLALVPAFTYDTGNVISDAMLELIAEHAVVRPALLVGTLHALNNTAGGSTVPYCQSSGLLPHTYQLQNPHGIIRGPAACPLPPPRPRHVMVRIGLRLGLGLLAQPGHG